MMSLKKYVCTFLITVGSFHGLQAQEAGNRLLSKEKWSLFIAPGGQNYLGDFLPRKYVAFGSTNDSKPSLKLGAEYQMGASLRVRMGYFGTKLSGDESKDFQKIGADEQWRKERALSFTNQIHELSLSAIWDILGYRKGKDGGVFQPWITPYVGVGVGYGFMNPKLGDTAKAYRYAVSQNALEYYDRDLQKAPLKGAVVFPVTIGVRWQFSPQSSVFVEGSRHFLTTDYGDRIANWNATQKNDGYINYAIGYRYNLVSGLRKVPL